jgi:hypothetical protein
VDNNFADISLEGDVLGRGKLIINGEDISNYVMGVQLVMVPGQVTTLHATQRVGAAKFQGPGVVYITSADEAEMTRIIDAVDPDALQREAMNRLGFDKPGEDKSMVAHCLDILREQINAA